jgi:hypothetical protein
MVNELIKFTRPHKRYAIFSPDAMMDRIFLCLSQSHRIVVVQIEPLNAQEENYTYEGIFSSGKLNFNHELV